MIDDESFNEVYKLLRGSSVAAAVLSAQTLNAEEKYSEAVASLEKTLEKYTNSRYATINNDLSHAEGVKRSSLDKETKRLVRKQDKANDTVKMMQDLIDGLRRKVRSQQSVTKPVLQVPQASLPQLHEKEQSPVPHVVTHADVLDSLKSFFLATKSHEERQRAIDKHFRVLEIESIPDIIPEELLLALSGGVFHLLTVDSIRVEKAELLVRSAMTNERMKPLTFESVSRSIERGKLQRLVMHDVELSQVDSTTSANLESTSSTSGPSTPNHPEADDSLAVAGMESKLSAQDRDQILDMGAFSQLIDAAQRSGIVPGIAIVIQVRDCEFRLGRYNQALQLMESQYSMFIGNATQRVQRLKQEDLDIANGKIKMLPREIIAKRARDSQQTESIERARMRFTRVMEGLRGVIHAESKMDLSNHAS